MTNKKDDKIKIEVSTYNWGPCVVKVKILDDFKKVLLEEDKKNEVILRIAKSYCYKYLAQDPPRRRRKSRRRRKRRYGK